jgi:site-specific DNA-methyltransferase (adenine-specific)
VLEGLAQLTDSSVDNVITDPPYGVNINPAWDSALPNEEVWNECERVLKPGGNCLIFGQPSMAAEFFSVLNNTKLDYRDTWIWAYQGTHTKGYKTKGGDFRSRIRNVYNPIYCYRKAIEGTEQENWEKYHTNLFNIVDNRQAYKGDHTAITDKYEKTGKKHIQSSNKSNTFGKLDRKGWVPNPNGSEPTNIQYAPRATKAERTINNMFPNTHETVKPMGIMLWLVSMVSNDHTKVILDPFCGSGTTGMACRLLGKKFIGIDNDAGWIELAHNRIEHVHSLNWKLFKINSV